MRLIRTRLLCIRLLKFRNITAVTLILALLYLLRRNNGEGQTSSKDTELFVIPHKTAMTSEKIQIFVPTSLKKIDWHNHTQILEDSRRLGFGDGGKPATMSKSEASLEEELYSVNGFNGALSDKIALNRSLPDIRHLLCKKRLYIESLPSVSVVVPFHNEHWSTLLRTATTAIIRSPPHILKEVLLVDDASTKEFLGAKLDRYLAEHLPRARVIRMPRRSGLIAARLAGARAAVGDVLLFLDSHTEANVNWLPPLLEPIALNYRTAVCPYIDVIAYDTFEYRAQDEGARGAFDWELFYKRLPLLPSDIKNMPDPFPSPVMAGGLFAISRAFFWELGGYDPELDIWGGEQYELSFKIWMCGGKMVDAPCSRVGHIYRKFAPFPNPEHGDFVAKQSFDGKNTRIPSVRKVTFLSNDCCRYENYRRVAEVWMDEYAQHLYARRPHYLKISPGNISDRVELRRSLRCKSFRWFMTQVAFDLTAHYPPIEPKPFGSGRISPIINPELCVDTRDGGDGRTLSLDACRRDRPQQRFVLSWHKDVKCPSSNVCWDLPESAPRSPVRLYGCHLGGGNQAWRFHVETHQFIQDADSCLEWNVSSRALFVNPCSITLDTQKWTLEHVDFEMMKQWKTETKAVTGPEVPDWYHA